MNNSEQESFWAGEFGNEYIERNRSERLLRSKKGYFKKILSSVDQVASVLELGCNIGLNLEAIHTHRPEVKLAGVEINEKAVNIARQNKKFNIIHDSIFNHKPERVYDLVFTAGVLIHVPPCDLNTVYDMLYNCSQRYILIYEYYNPTPMELPYRGHKNKLFKRDFAGEIMDRFPGLSLKDYGFIYHRDPEFPDDDLNWFLMEKV